jgi:hypothetical protein
MNSRIRNLLAIIILSALQMVSSASIAVAGPYTDALSMCLVRSTTEADKNLLVQWIFATIALHPQVASMAAVSYEQRDALNEGFASMAMNLLTDTCVKETREALKYEGSSALETSFGVLGEVATRELFTNPEVATGLAELGKYMDEDRFQSILTEEEAVEEEAVEEQTPTQESDQ